MGSSLLLNNDPNDEDESLILCAEQLLALSASSALAFVDTLRALEQARNVTKKEWNQYFEWAHPIVRLQAQEVLDTSGVVSAAPGGYTVDVAKARTVRVVLRAMSRHYQLATSPPVYVTPADLLPAIHANVGELRRLLVSLIAGAEKRVVIFTPFFSLHALQEIVAPLHSSNAALRLYISLQSDRIDKTREIVEAIEEEAPSVSLSLFLNSRSPKEWDSIPHAKLVLCDGLVGYLGSANISRQGLHDQFEVGVRLNKEAVHVLEQVIDELVGRGVFEPLHEIELG